MSDTALFPTAPSADAPEHVLRAFLVEAGRFWLSALRRATEATLAAKETLARLTSSPSPGAPVKDMAQAERGIATLERGIGDWADRVMATTSEVRDTLLAEHAELERLVAAGGLTTEAEGARLLIHAAHKKNLAGMVAGLRRADDTQRLPQWLPVAAGGGTFAACGDPSQPCDIGSTVRPYWGALGPATGC